MWENIIERGRPQMAIRRMRIACWITNATVTHSEYVIIIIFPLQHSLREHASLLLYTYIMCVVNSLFSFYLTFFRFRPNSQVSFDFSCQDIKSAWPLTLSVCRKTSDYCLAIVLCSSQFQPQTALLVLC
jgi:hypothetical protein